MTARKPAGRRQIDRASHLGTRSLEPVLEQRDDDLRSHEGREQEAEIDPRTLADEHDAERDSDRGDPDPPAQPREGSCEPLEGTGQARCHPLGDIDVRRAERLPRVSDRQQDKASNGDRQQKGEARQAPWQRLYFLPLPHQHGSLRPTSLCSFTTGSGANEPEGAGGAASAVLAPPAPAAAMTSAPADVSCS